MNKKIIVADFNNLGDKKPAYALVSKTDLVIIKYDEKVSVFYGRCPHRGALLADGYVDGHNLICGVHNW
ncbi:MAG: Rieske (2Fe-2S) protein, partial [Ignavibacteria bacterium]|nr:Rieske (2Fe-2S) protein [Ignavibacteria bacterium]